MAAALLVSRNEPSWCGNQAACNTKHPTTAPGFHYEKFHTNPNPYPDQAPNPRHIYNAGGTIHAHNVVADNRLPYPGGPTQKPPNAADSKMFPHRTVTFKLAAYTRVQLKDLQNRLISELEQVRSLRNRIESANIVTRPVYPPPKVSGTKKGSVGRPANPLNRDKGLNPKRRVGRPPREGRATAAGLMKQCSQILQKLMKHQFAWIFNTPVNVKALGLHDYHLIIHAPMDLGTVKSKLRKKFYPSPLEFAADVRLTFNNALTYNPKGDDANTMAGLLLNEFEEMFKALLKPPEAGQNPIMIEESLQEQEPVVIEDCARDGYAPVSSKGSEVEVLTPMGMDIRHGEMSFEEKQQLGSCLGDLPPEKMAEMMEILRNRNGFSTLNNDEIEVDIDALDSETLWELERFVAHHNKMVSESRCQQSLPESLIQVREEVSLKSLAILAPLLCLFWIACSLLMFLVVLRS